MGRAGLADFKSGPYGLLHEVVLKIEGVLGAGGEQWSGRAYSFEFRKPR